MESEFIVWNFASSPGSRKYVVRKGEKRAWKQNCTHIYKPHLHTHTDPVCPDTTLLQLLCFSDVALFYLKNVVAIKSVVQ